MDFVALDVETANAKRASICQIGVALFKDRSMAEEWKTYVDPEDFFDPFNVSIHRIDEETVRGAPKFPDIVPQLCRLLNGRVVVCHTQFDRVAIHQAFKSHDIPLPEWVWLDSAGVARRTWEEFARKGYGLGNLCEKLGYTFKHHDALEDAKAAAHVLIAAMQKSGLGLDDWVLRIKQPIGTSAEPHSDTGQVEKADGPHHGEVLVFTGALAIPRREAAEVATRLGFVFANGVTKETAVLVVGIEDKRHLAGYEKSSKHRKAEELILQGHPIRILSEADFEELARTTAVGTGEDKR